MRAGPVFGAARAGAWVTARGTLSLDRPRIMGVVNVTPDSFWPDSRAASDAALAAAGRQVEAGADLIDVGGESTRPGAAPVPATEERARVVPLVRAILRRWPGIMVSVDTVKAEVARAVLDEGAAVINDVSALRLDPALGPVVAEAGAGLVLMHSRGRVDTMASYELARYDDDPAEVIALELGACVDAARAAGVAEDRIALDPGLGFAKRTAHSIRAIAGLGRLLALGRPVLVGPSRKRFVGDVAGGLPPEDRLPGTIAACVAALERGARIFRVHDVLSVRRALAVADAVLNARADSR